MAPLISSVRKCSTSWQIIAPPEAAAHTIYHEPLDGQSKALAIDASGERLAVAFEDGRIALWKIDGATYEECKSVRRVVYPGEGPEFPGRDKTVAPLLTQGEPSPILVARFRLVGELESDFGQKLANAIRGDLGHRMKLTMPPTGSELDDIYDILAAQCTVGVCEPLKDMNIVNRLKGKIIIVGSATRAGADGLDVTVSRYGPLPEVGPGSSSDNVRRWTCKRCSESDLTDIASEISWVISH